jgi:outer membrane lipoprotein-sorting protein
VVIAAAAVASADATPSLAPRTAAQLLTEVAQGSKVPLGPVSATVQETSSLGMPQLPAFAQQDGGPTGLTSGSKSISIWYRDPQHVRVAEMVQAGETDLRLDGRTLWVWSSKTQTATRYTLPARVSGVPAITKGNGLVPPSSHQGFPAVGNSVPDTPQAAAAQLLKAVGPTTVVSVQRNVYVAGRAAYQLSLVPRSSKSLVGSVLIAIDAARHIPLRVEVYARASAALAYGIGFTALTFGTPAASNFSFTPPPGATVNHVTVPGSPQGLKAGLGIGALGGLGLGPIGAVLGASAGHASSAGISLPRVRVGSLAPLVRVQKMRIAIARSARLPALSKNARAKIEAQFAKSLPKSIPAAQRAKMIKAFGQQLARSPKMQGMIAQRIFAVRSHHGVIVKGNNGGFIKVGAAPIAAAAGSAPHVIGSGWLSVLATPPSQQVANAVKQAASGANGTIQQGSAFYGSSSSSISSASTSPGFPAVPVPALLQALLAATTPVHGSWGSGRLLQTTLLTVLITSKGQILAGAVSPSVLYADVARDAA